MINGELLMDRARRILRDPPPEVGGARTPRSVFLVVAVSAISRAASHLLMFRFCFRFLDGRVPTKSSRADYETAIAATGYGRFHYWLLLASGWANAADAVEILCVSFLLPAAQCDLKLSSEDKGLLSAIVFVGMMLGGYLWGGLGDSLGRRGVLIFSMAFNSLFGMFSALAMDFPTFLLLRFFSGVGYVLYPNLT